MRKLCPLIEKSSTMKKQAKVGMADAAGLSFITNIRVLVSKGFFTWPIDFDVKEVGMRIDH